MTELTKIEVTQKAFFCRSSTIDKGNEMWNVNINANVSVRSVLGTYRLERDGGGYNSPISVCCWGSCLDRDHSRFTPTRGGNIVSTEGRISDKKFSCSPVTSWSMNWYWRRLVKSGQHTNHTQWRKIKQKLGISYNNILQQLGRGKIFALSPFWSFPLFPPFRLLDLTLRWAAQQYDGNIDSSTKWYFPLVFQEPKSPHNIFHIIYFSPPRREQKYI